MFQNFFANVWFEVHIKIKILLKSKLWLQLFDFSFSLKNGIFVSMFIQTNWTWQKFILRFAFGICSRQWTFAWSLASSSLAIHDYPYLSNSSQAEYFKNIFLCWLITFKEKVIQIKQIYWKIRPLCSRHKNMYKIAYFIYRKNSLLIQVPI